MYFGLVADTEEGMMRALGRYQLKKMGNPEWLNYSVFNEAEMALFAAKVAAASEQNFAPTDRALREDLTTAVRLVLAGNSASGGLPWIDKHIRKGGSVPEFGPDFMQR